MRLDFLFLGPKRIEPKIMTPILAIILVSLLYGSIRQGLLFSLSKATFDRELLVSTNQKISIGLGLS